MRGSCPCSGTAIRRYGGATSCVAVSRDVPGQPPLILDLGTGCRRLGEEIRAEWPVTPGGPGLAMAAMVTHLHFDHVQGLPFFVPTFNPENSLDIYAPPPPSGTLAETFASFIRPPFFPVHVADLGADIRFHEVEEGELVVGAMKVSVRKVPHVGVTCGFRVEADGLRVAFVSDHQAPKAFDHVADSVLELCDGVDLLIHDAQYTEEEFRGKAHWGHSTIAYAVRVAGEAGARKLALYHHDPTHDDEMLDDLEKEARQLGDAAGLDDVLMAAEGLTVQVGESAPHRLA